MASESLEDSFRQILAIFEESGAPLTTPEVGDRLDFSRRTTYNRLERLVDQGRLETKKVGASARVWWRSSRDVPSSETSDPQGSAQTPRKHREFRSLVDAVEEYAIFLLDVDGHIQSWNPGATKIKGYTAEEVVGEHFSIFYSEEDLEDAVPEANLDAAAADGETEDEGWRVRKDGSIFWANVTITAIRDDKGDLEGFAKVTRDMTERKAKERRLEQQRDELGSELDDVLDRISAGFFGLDEDLRFTYINPRAESLLDLPGPATIGSDVRSVLTLTESLEAALQESFGSQVPVSLEDYSEPIGAWFEYDIYPSDSGVSVYFSEITARKEREQELERYVGIIDAVREPAYELDTQGRFVFVNEPFVEQSEYTEDELLGEHVSIGMDEDTISWVESQITERLTEAQNETISLEYKLQKKDGSRVPVENRISVLTDEYGQFDGTVGILRDITERKQREHALELYERIVSEARDGIYVVDEEFCFSKVNDAYVEMTGYDRRELLGTHCSLVVDDDVVENSAESLDDVFAGEASSATLEADIQQADGGTLRAESKFTGFVDTETGERMKIGIVRDVSERVERERELEHHREQLEVLNNLNEVVRNITEAVIDQSTREEIETIVCDRLAGVDSYEFAWIAEVDPQTQSIRPRVEAGVDGYLEKIPVSTDPDEPAGQGPGGRAVRTREVQVSQDALSDSDFEPWWAYAREYGYKSSAAIPIVYDEPSRHLCKASKRVRSAGT